MSAKTCEVCGANTPYTDWARCEMHNTQLANDAKMATNRTALKALARIADGNETAHGEMMSAEQMMRIARAVRVRLLETVATDANHLLEHWHHDREVRGLRRQNLESSLGELAALDATDGEK